jgi:hypothetical protein
VDCKDVAHAFGVRGFVTPFGRGSTKPKPPKLTEWLRNNRRKEENRSSDIIISSLVLFFSFFFSLFILLEVPGFHFLSYFERWGDVGWLDGTIGYGGIWSEPAADQSQQ